MVKTKYEYKIKQYAPRLVKNIEDYSVKIYDLVLGKADLPVFSDNNPGLDKDLRAARKLLNINKRQIKVEQKRNTLYISQDGQKIAKMRKIDMVDKSQWENLLLEFVTF